MAWPALLQFATPMPPTVTVQQLSVGVLLEVQRSVAEFCPMFNAVKPVGVGH